MDHLHTYLNLEKNGIVQVMIDSPANVYLMDDTEYGNYCKDNKFKAFGGFVKTRSKKIKAPAAGNWHLVIDTDNKGSSVNISLQLVNGKTINELWETGEKTPETVEDEAADTTAENPKELEKKKKELLKELNKLLKQLNLEGLLFLMKQATTLHHNQQVEKINSEIDEFNKKARAVSKKKKSIAKGAPEKSPSIDIVENGENSFILVVNSARKFLSRDELRKVVSICHEEISETEYSGRIFNWLKKNRSDILTDGKIGSGSNLFYKGLRDLVRGRYVPKK